MKILERYILKENLKPFLVSLSVITFLLLLDHLIDLLNLIIDKHLDLLTVGWIFALSLPFIMALSVPMSVLTASIMSFGRLSTDNELVAFKSCGINIYTLLRPTVIAALFLSIFMIYFNDRVLPEANHQLKNMYIKANARRPISVLKPGVFTELKNYTIYVKEHVGDEMLGIIIYNQEDRKFPQTITAERGRILLSNGGNSLRATLYNGEMHVIDPTDNDRYEVRTFKRFVLNIPDLGFSQQEISTEYRGDREMSTKEMKGRIVENEQNIVAAHDEIADLRQKIAAMEKMGRTEENVKELKKNRNLLNIKLNKVGDMQKDIRVYEVEIHKKYAIAFACLIFVLVGAPVGMMTRTSGVGMSFSVSSFVFLVYYIALIGGEELADRGYMSPMLSMWVANILLGIAGIILILLSVREQRFINLNIFKEKLGKLLRLT